MASPRGVAEKRLPRHHRSECEIINKRAEIKEGIRKENPNSGKGSVGTSFLMI